MRLPFAGHSRGEKISEKGFKGIKGSKGIKSFLTFDTCVTFVSHDTFFVQLTYMDIAADVATEGRLHAKQATKNVIGAFKDFGTEFVKQMFGQGNNAPANVTDDQIAQMKTDDKTFSDAAYSDTRGRIIAMYEEHRMKKLREEEEKRELERVENQKKMEKLRGETLVAKQQKSQDIATAMGKASAETGRSYGAE